MANVAYQSLYRSPSFRVGLSGVAVDTWSEISKGECYSAELDACLNNLDLKSYPHCAELQAAYDEDYDATEASVVNLPFCQPFYQQHYSLTQVLIVGAAIASITGLLSGVACALGK